MSGGEDEAPRPKVSVCMITYNHEKYVGQAIDSVLMQETSFPYELVIGEDCSTDRTREIVLRYQQERPAIVRVLCHEKNLGMLRNLATTLEACRGEYIALLEGDDYWTASAKLQRQVELLDAHPETAICGHQAILIWEDGSCPSKVLPDRSTSFLELRDLLANFSCFIPTCSAMFRQRSFPGFPPWYFKLKIGDLPLLVLNARHGNIALLAEPMAVYRIHRAGVWSAWNWSQHLEAVAEAFERFNVVLEREYRPIIRDTLFKAYCWLGLTALAERDLPRARRWTRKCLTILPPHRRLRDKLHLGLQAYAPSLHRGFRSLKRGLGVVGRGFDFLTRR